MRRALAILLLGCVALALPVPAAPAPLAGLPAAPVAVLLHHPLDGVDPFGVPFGGSDTFAARYPGVAAATGRFDYPVFVANGGHVIQGLPEPGRPYEGTLEAYRAALAAELAKPAAAAMRLEVHVAGGALLANVTVSPVAPVADPQGQEVRLLLAVTEDAIHYQPPAPVSNGVTEHRFVVRALRDLGPIPLASGATAWREAQVPLGSGWEAGRLSAVAWLQAGPGPGRFADGEVLQAAAAPADGQARIQQGRGVLLEGYSATWCSPCLLGDRAMEELAVQNGAAAPLAAASPGYLRAPEQPILAALASVAAAVAVLLWARRRP